MQLKTARWLAIVAILAMALGACGNPSNAAPETDGDQGVAMSDSEESHDEAEDDHADEAEDDHVDEAEHSEDGFAFGEPAEPSDADRVIEVEANDDLTFGPNEFEVSVGETIQFEITNSGVLPHDFTIGDEQAQEAHEEEMAEGGMEHSDPNAVVLEPGETETLTWKFTETGTVLIGCHQPGHYAGGMTGTIEVAA